MSSTLWSLVLLAAAGQLAADQGAAFANQASLERIVADLAAFELSLAIEPPEKLMLSGAPVLRWSNPIRNVDDAAVFIWSSKERPEALSTVMSYRDAQGNLRRAYEFLSLSQDGLAAVHKGVLVWRPNQAGVRWRTLPDAPSPGDMATERRRQMHRLASEFQVAVQSDENRYELRLLSQPLFRYQNAQADIRDGALFAFVEGVDPEMILVLECSSKKPVWRFGTGRLTRWAIQVRHHGNVVSDFPQTAGAGAISDVYLIPDAGPLDPPVAR